MTGEARMKRNLWTRMEVSPILMVGLVEAPEHSEPLTARLDPDQVDTLWVFVGRNSRLAKGGRAMAQFVSKGHDYFACLAGMAQVVEDKVMLDKLWAKDAETWFPGGKSDPDLALLRVDIDCAELWETDTALEGKLKKLLGKTDSGTRGGHAHVETTAGTAA